MHGQASICLRGGRIPQLARPQQGQRTNMASYEPAVLISAADVHQPQVRSLPLTDDNAVRAFSEKSIGYNHYMVYARALSITWGSDPRYWRWLSLEEDIDVEVAELRDVCWLEVKGKIGMNCLEPGVKYEVMFVILMINPSGFEPKATFSLELPGGRSEEKKLSLAAIKPKQWVKVKIGEFVATPTVGDVIFSLTNYEKLNWKKGLIIEGVLIQPRA